MHAKIKSRNSFVSVSLCLQYYRRIILVNTLFFNMGSKNIFYCFESKSRCNTPALFPNHFLVRYMWDKVFKSGPSKICGRQPLKNLKWYSLLKQTIFLQISSTNFTWSTLEYFVSCVLLLCLVKNISCILCM